MLTVMRQPHTVILCIKIYPSLLAVYNFSMFLQFVKRIAKFFWKFDLCMLKKTGSGHDKMATSLHFSSVRKIVKLLLI